MVKLTILGVSARCGGRSCRAFLKWSDWTWAAPAASSRKASTSTYSLGSSRDRDQSNHRQPASPRVAVLNSRVISGQLSACSGSTWNLAAMKITGPPVSGSAGVRGKHPTDPARQRVECSTRGRSPADMDGGAVAGVGLDLADDLAGHRGGVALAEQQVAQQVGDGMALGPLEVAVGPQAADLGQAEQDGGEGVGDHRALGPQHPVAVDLDPADLQGPGEVRGVPHRDLEEQHRRTGRDGVHVPLLALLEGVLGGVAGLALVGDDVQPAAPDGLADELAGPGVETDPVGPQLGAAPDPGDQGDEHDADHEAE